MKIEIEERSYDRLLKLLLSWSTPPNEIEIAVTEHLEQLNSLRVPCISIREMERFGYRSNVSHQNCLKFCDRNRDWRIVSGWQPDNDTYTPYSVVEREGTMRSVTPAEFSSSVDFIPDTDLVFHSHQGGRISASWRGIHIPLGCRRRPVEMAAAGERLYKRLSGGTEWLNVCREMSKNGFPV